MPVSPTLVPSRPKISMFLRAAMFSHPISEIFVRLIMRPRRLVAPLSSAKPSSVRLIPERER